MNKFIEQQLKKCRANLPDWNCTTTKLVIPMNGSKVSEQKDLVVGNRYKIKLANYIVNEPPNFTLSANWNKGTKPPEVEMIISITKIMGKMVQVSGMGVNLNFKWSGWLPKKGIIEYTEI